MVKRIIAIILSVLLAVSVMTGCDRSGDKDTIDSGNSVGNKEKYAYQAVVSPLSGELLEGFSLTNINSFCVSGNTAYITADFVSEEVQEISEYVDPASAERYEDNAAYRTAMFAIDLTSNDIIQTKYSQAVLPEGVEGSFSLSELCAGPEGSVWVIETAETYRFDLPSDFDETEDSKWSYYSPAESIVNILQFGPDGEQLSSNGVDLEGEIGSYFNFMADYAGNLYCTDLSNIFVYGNDSSLLCTLSYENGYLIQLDAQGVGLLTFDLNGNSVIKRIDPATGSYLPDLTLDNGSVVPQSGNATYLYTYISDGKVFGVDAKADKNVQILDFLACDINDNRISDYMILDDGTVAALQTRSDASESSQYDLVMISMTDVSALPEKKIVTLGCQFINDRIKEHIIRFNQTSDSVRVQLVDPYSSEAMPDMFMTNMIPLEQYAAEGKLIDLWPFIEQDSELSADVLMSHVFETASIDGKLYEAASSFVIHTAAGKKDYVGATRNWDHHELVQARSYLEDNGTIFGTEHAAENFLNGYVYQILDSFIDWEEGTALFNSEDFTNLLEFAGILSDEGIVAAENTGKKSNEFNRLYSNTQLLTVNQIDSFDQIKYANAMHRGEAAFVGYPTSFGAGNLLMLTDPIAITAQCEDPSAAWTFVRTFLTEEYQIGRSLNGFPTNKNVFDQYAASEMEAVYETDATGNKAEVSSGTIQLDGILSLELFAVTEDEYNQFMDLYENSKDMARSNTFLTELIKPEIFAMLDTGTSASETADAINSVVTEYLLSDN